MAHMHLAGVRVPQKTFQIRLRSCHDKVRRELSSVYLRTPDGPNVNGSCKNR
jgi:hypothetical protein